MLTILINDRGGDCFKKRDRAPLVVFTILEINQKCELNHGQH